MESWRSTWRKGVAPLLTVPELSALADALRRDDPALIQGATTYPPPLHCVAEWPVEAACLLGYCGWKGDDLTTVAKTEEFFARICYEADQLLSEPAGIGWLLNPFDTWPRQEMIANLLPEVELALENARKGA